MKEKEQLINCDVCACTHHDKSNCMCKLKSITVCPCEEQPTAHFCKNYKEK